MKSRAFLARLGLLVLSIIVSLSVCEVLLRRLVSQRVASAGVEREYFCKFDPTLGWDPIPNLTARHERDGFSVVVHQNGFGLRAPDSLQPTRQTKQRRILVLGDSYVWGYGVEQWQVMTAPEVQTSAELINFGVSGYGTDQEFLFYLRQGTKFDVDEVQLVFTPYNDLEESLSAEEYDRDKPFFVVEHGKLVLHTEHIRKRNVRTFINRLRFHSQVINLFDSAIRNLRNRMKLRRLRMAGQPQDRPLNENDITQRDREGVDLTAKIIAALRDAVTARGAKFSVIFVPYKPHILLNQPHNHPLVPLLARELTAQGISHYDPYELFLKEKQNGLSLFNKADNHFSPEGNALFAKVLTSKPAAQ